MNEHELMLRHAAKWARENNRPLDVDTLDEVLRLRATHDGHAANHWRAQSVKHVLLVRWPAHGPIDTPDVPLLIDSLETYLRFLFTTGRIAAGSASLKDLLRETTSAGRQMAAASADPANFSVTKSVLAFGREIGLSLDDLADADQANAVLQQIMTAWNGLPMAERQRRSAGPANAGSRMGRALADVVGGLMAGESPPEGWQLPAPPRLDAEDDLIHPVDPAVSAPLYRASSYMKQVLALVEWVGSGRQVTATEVLRPAVAREAVADLGLQEWERGWDAATRMRGESQCLVYDGPAWRSAIDCVMLDRLWFAAVNTELIRVSRTKAVAERGAIPDTDQEWALLGQDLLLALAMRAQYDRALGPLHDVLFNIAGPHGRPRTVDELADLWWSSPRNDMPQSITDQDFARALSDRTLARCLAMFGDTGAWIDNAGTLASTEISSDVALVVILGLEEGLLKEL